MTARRAGVHRQLGGVPVEFFDDDSAAEVDRVDGLAEALVVYCAGDPSLGVPIEEVYAHPPIGWAVAPGAIGSRTLTMAPAFSGRRCTEHRAQR